MSGPPGSSSCARTMRRRSLAAKVLLDHHAAGRVEVRSAGSDPGDNLNP